MNSRATPPLGGPSGNQQCTIYFDAVMESKDEKDANKGGAVLDEAQRRKATNTVKKLTNQSDEKDLHSKAKDRNGIKSKSTGIRSSSTPHRYQGRLGNPMSSHPATNTAPPKMKKRSASLPVEKHARDMDFEACVQNPSAPITAIFDLAAQERGVKFDKTPPAAYSDGGMQGMPSHSKKIAHDKFSCWARFNPSKFWKRFFGYASA